MMVSEQDFFRYDLYKGGDCVASYEIYKDPSSNKYGIRNLDKDITIIKCVFDQIVWLEENKLVRFTLNGKQALYRVEQLETLKVSCR